MKIFLTASIFTLLIAGKSFRLEAFSFEFQQNPSEEDFRTVSKDLVTPLRFLFLPPAGEGSLPLQLGVQISRAPLSSSGKDIIGANQTNAAPGETNTLGIALGGLQYSRNLTTGFWLMGVGFSTGDFLPNLPVFFRVAYNYLHGNKQFCAPAANAELVARWGHGMLTLYGGIGTARYKASLRPSNEQFNSYDVYWAEQYGLAGVKIPLSKKWHIGGEGQFSENQQNLRLLMISHL